MSDVLNIGVLVSGSGTNLQAILDEIATGGLPVRVSLVVSSRPDAYGITRAEEAGIPTLVMNREKYADREAADQEIVDALKDAGAEYVVMAGYMRMDPGHAQRVPRPRHQPPPRVVAFV